MYQLFFKYTQPITPTSLLKINDRYKIIVRNGSFDRYALNEVWSQKIYLSPEKLKNHQVKTIVDIGAYIGDSALWFSHQYPNSTIYAFEPNSENFNFLSQNIKLNYTHRIKIFPTAVTSKSTSISFHTDTHNSAGHLISINNKSLIPNARSLGFSEFIRIHKIKKIDILKLDCEGSEYDIIFNTPRYIFAKIDNIILEFHDYLNPIYNYHKLEKCLIGLGYKTSIRQNMVQKVFLNAGMIYATKHPNV